MDNRKVICDIISEMLDNPDEYEIYPTAKCYDQLEAVIDAKDASLADCQSRLGVIKEALSHDGNVETTDDFRICRAALLDLVAALDGDFACPGCQEKGGRLAKARQAWGVLEHMDKDSSVGYLTWHEAVDTMSEALAENEEGKNND